MILDFVAFTVPKNWLLAEGSIRTKDYSGDTGGVSLGVP